jgi:S1-C subfamily serine protease
MRYPDYYKPWAKQAPTEVIGTGVVIKNKRILTNAHLVLYASQVQVQANQSGTQMSAIVEAVAPDIRSQGSADTMAVWNVKTAAAAK